MYKLYVGNGDGDIATVKTDSRAIARKLFDVVDTYQALEFVDGEWENVTDEFVSENQFEEYMRVR